MDTTRALLAIAPPAGGNPPRTKSLRQQRAFNGANIIKAYVQQSEQRRAQSKFNSTGSMLQQTPIESTTSDDPRCEELLSPTDPARAVTLNSPHGAIAIPNPHGNQQELDDAKALEALFSERRNYRSQRPSVASMQRPPVIGQQGASPTHGSISLNDPQGSNLSMKPIMRRRLQMETPGLVAAAGTSTPYRPLASAAVPHHPRSKHNLAAKLDAMAKSSVWGRRKVVMTEDKSAKGGGGRTASPRHNNVAVVDSNNGGAPNMREASQVEIEMKVMAAFRQSECNFQSAYAPLEAAAVSMMNGNASGIATGTGRNGSKFRKDLTAQSSNVVGILSRRLIREVPALKFFDEESEVLAPVVPGGAGTTATKSAASGASATATLTLITDRAKPRGVCYTLDAFGCRKIKMQSSSIKPSRRANRADRADHKHEELTVEKAMSRSLHRKMARRVKGRRQTIMRLTDEFSRSRRELAKKLRSQLALQHAEIEKMFSKRLTLLMSDDTTLPPYQAQKELHLARMRCKKARLLERCQTLRVLGEVLKHVESTGVMTGQEVTTGELHFLDLFRCVVEENQVITPIISDAIRQHIRGQDVQQPIVKELFDILDKDMPRSARTARDVKWKQNIF